jgi:endonuclease/exonuclease/phosphatase family metal-dependent hydrolase
MQITTRPLPKAAGLVALVLSACFARAAWSENPVAFPILKIATWNLEWLIAPVDFKPLKAGCAPAGVRPRGDVRRLPCDVVTRFERSSRDFAMLARYARELDADVVALQEVDGPNAARLVFPDYEFCFTGRRHVQNTGFAIRRGVPHRCGPDLRALSSSDSLRRGAELILYPGEAGEVRLLSVHLKSGCPTKLLTAPADACRDLARQVPALERWIDDQASARRRFAILGDFNRDLLAEQRSGRAAGSLWSEIDDGTPAGANLHNAAAGQPFRNCMPGQGFRSYIDHILLSRSLASAALPASFSRVTYRPADARHARLSDHCPVSIRLRVGS